MNRVCLDVSAAASAAELHALMKQALAFPRWYGDNLDALYDCLTDLGVETHLTLTGTHSLAAVLGDRWGAFARTLADAAAENPCFTFSLQ